MIFTEGGSGTAATVVQADSSHPDVINVADAELLSCGAFHRAGPDLHLNGRDGQHVIIPGYFASEHPATLVAPSGERLTADVLAVLVKSANRDEYAQAQPANISSDAPGHIAPDAIGHVEKVVGDVTAVRDGVAVTLHVGDTVYKSDIIQTGSSSSVGIFFSDGSAVNLVANTRMVLNEYSYGANSDSNAALFSLVEGTFAFVVGKVAHGSDMKIATSVATMSVRDGTSGWAHQLTSSEIAAISAKLGNDSYSFAVFNDHGLRSHGIYDLVVDGAVVGSVDDPNLVSYLDRQGDLISLPLNKSDLAQDFLQWLSGNDAEPSALQAIHGSGSPIDAPTFQQLVNLDLAIPSFNFNPNGGGTTFGVGFVPGPPLLPPGVGFVPGLPFLPPSVPPPHSNVFIWNGIGDWDRDPFDWNQGFAPTSPIDIVIIQTGKSSYHSGYTIGSLTVDFGATLNMVGGSLTVSSIANAGLVELNSSGVDPALVIDGALSLTGGGAIKMLGPTTGNFIVGLGGTGATLTNIDNLVSGSGNIGKGDGNLSFRNDAQGTVDADLRGEMLLIDTGADTIVNAGLFEATHRGTLEIEGTLDNSGKVVAHTRSDVLIEADTTNESSGKIVARGTGAEVDFVGTARDRISVDNLGDIAARHRGTVSFEFAHITNEGGKESDAAGRIVALGRDSLVDIRHSSVDNEGLIAAEHGGSVAFRDDGVRNESDGFISATGSGSELRFQHSRVENFGEITAAQRAEVTFDGSRIDNDRHGTIVADGRGSEIRFDDDRVDNLGAIGALSGGSVLFDESSIKNARGGAIEADGRGSEVVFDRDLIDNAGRIEAEHHGNLEFVKSFVDNNRHGTIEADGQGSDVKFERDQVDNSGLIEAKHDGEVTFEESRVDNSGMIAAVGRGSTVDLDHTFIAGGGLGTAQGGLIETVGGNSTLSDVTIAFDSDVRVEGGATLTLGNGSTMAGGTLAINAHGTLHVEPSLAILNCVNVVNDGNIVVDPGSATLEVENGATITGGHLTVGASGTLDVDGSTLANVAISDAGVVNFGSGDTLSPTDVLTFVGNGTVKVEGNTSLDLTLAGLTTGDIIDLGNIVVTSAVWNGSSLILNGVPVAFSVAGGLPAGDTFAFRPDGSGGTDLTVLPQLVGVSATPAAGTEGSPIPVSFSVTGGATVNSIVISDIPPGATLSDGHGNSFTATAQLNSIDVHAWNMGSLTVTPPNDTDFTLSATVTVTDGNGYSYSAATTETVTVSPHTPPSVSTGAHATASYETGAGTPVALDTAVSVSDPDSNGNLAGAKVTISQGFLAGDTLAANIADTSITANYDPTSGILTLSGLDTLAHYAQVLDSVTYASTAIDPTNNGADTSRTMSWQVDDGVSPSNVATSTVSIATGSATVAVGATVEITSPSNQTVTFAGGTGELELDDPAAFGGHIIGFSATASDSDVIDLVGIDFNSSGFTESYDAASHLLTVSDETHGASLTFDYFDNLLNFASDHNGGTLITTQTAAIASGGLLEISKLTVGTVTFGAATGTLQIDNPADFSGHIQNFTGTAPDAADSDVIDLVGIDYNSAKFSYDVASGKLTVTEGALSANLTFDYFGNNLLNFASDGHDGTAITTQPANIASGGSLEISKLTVGTISFFGTGDLLTLDNPGVFSGHIDGFSGGDSIDVSGINFAATHFTESYNASSHLLTVGDGTQSASFYLDYLSNALNFASDGKGGTLITNQPTGPETVAAGERLDVWTLDSSTITFSGGTGELKLDNPSGFSGHIAGFTGTAPDTVHSDVIDLVGIDYNSGQFAETYDAATGVLSVTDGTHNASFIFDNFGATLHFASDNNGGTLITDPPAPAAANTGAAASGGGDNFKFIFHPGGGAATIAHIDWQHEATVADHPPTQSPSFTPADFDRDWLTDHDHMTSNTPQHLQAHLASAIHLH